LFEVCQRAAAIDAAVGVAAGEPWCGAGRATMAGASGTAVEHERLNPTGNLGDQFGGHVGCPADGSGRGKQDGAQAADREPAGTRRSADHGHAVHRGWRMENGQAPPGLVEAWHEAGG
jgi:hypothetical protein